MLGGRDFGGYVLGSITGHVADDLNGNGVDDPGEPGNEVRACDGQPGAMFDYTIVVSNAGPDAAEFVGVSDTLPSGVTFDSASAGCSYSAPDADCALGTIAGGGSATVTITVLAVDSGAIANSASVASETGDPSEANNGGDADVTVTPVADVQVVKTGSASVAAGGSATYTLTATNSGPSAATGVVLRDTLPSGMTFVSLSVPAGTSCTTPSVGAGGTITCTTATVADGASVVVTLVARAGFSLAETFADNSATVAADELDPNSANNGDGVSTRVGPASDLRLQKTASVPALTQGQPLTYTLTSARQPTCRSSRPRRRASPRAVS